MSRPRLAFVGTGWIGSARMRAVVKAGAAEAAVVADLDLDAAAKAAVDVGCEIVEDSLEAALRHEVDGVVLATPSALHAEQARSALRQGVAVFCQKPLGRTEQECAQVIAAAREANLLLGVDLSYRFAEAFAAAGEVVRTGEIGRVYAADLVFHNAYGPDKSWFTDPALSGGGCVIDLGTHLIDLAIQALQQPVVHVDAALFSQGAPLVDPAAAVEDYAVAQLTMADGAVVRLACSWFLPAGTDAIIEAHFHGAAGGVSVRNVNGSFYDFTCDRFEGRSSKRLVDAPDEWGGRALVAWANTLAHEPGYDPSVESVLAVAHTIDEIYGRAS